MPYIDLINRVMQQEMGQKGLEIVEKQLSAMNLEPKAIEIEHIPAVAKSISEAVVAVSTREQAKKVYWELLKLLDIEKIVDGTEDPLLKAAQLADLGDAASCAGEWVKALEYYRQIADTAAPGSGPLAEIKEGELHASMNEQDEAREHFGKAAQIAKENGNFIMEAMALRGIGYTCWRTGDFPEAIERFSKAISVALQVEDQDMVGKLTIDIGLVHQATGLYDKAIRKFEEAIEILSKSGDWDELARAYNNLGEVYKAQKDYNKALMSYQSCLEYAEKVRNEIMKAFALMNSAECYARQCHVGEAKEMLDQAKPLVEEMKDDYLLSAVYLVNGLIAAHEGDWECVENSFEEDIELLKKIGYPYEVATNTLEYAKALVKKGDKDKAREKLKEARKILVSLSSTKLLTEIDEVLSGLE